MMPSTTASVNLSRRSTAQADRPPADVIDHALTALQARRLTKVTYLAELDRDDAGARLTTALGRLIEQRSSGREQIFVDVRTGSVVRILLDRGDRDDKGAPAAFMAEYVALGAEPRLYQRLVDASHSHTPQPRRTPGQRSR
ncbi:hypothetical protein [Amycolatopsis sp. lyj-112]|uniref:hypothetical protein n=1 Tax=Amycolatopsis sp. lyj-112 TaxID=2789288 RepID=UPI00397B07DD